MNSNTNQSYSAYVLPELSLPQQQQSYSTYPTHELPSIRDQEYLPPLRLTVRDDHYSHNHSHNQEGSSAIHSDPGSPAIQLPPHSHSHPQVQEQETGPTYGDDIGYNHGIRYTPSVDAW